MDNEARALLHIMKPCSVGSTKQEHSDYVDASRCKCVSDRLTPGPLHDHELERVMVNRN